MSDVEGELGFMSFMPGNADVIEPMQKPSIGGEEPSLDAIPAESFSKDN